MTGCPWLAKLTHNVPWWPTLIETEIAAPDHTTVPRAEAVVVFHVTDMGLSPKVHNEVGRRL